jgi:hypothetical protein
MRRTKVLLTAITAACLLGSPLIGNKVIVAADTASAPSLVISQLKITSSNGQFITLYNTTNTAVDMSKYQLQYFNSYDLGKATSSKLIALSGLLPPHGYYMVNDSALLLCYQLTINSVSLGLSSTAGMVELLAFSQSTPGGSVTPILQDYVAWSKTAATGAQTLPVNLNAFLLRQPVDSQNRPSISSPGSGSWQIVQPDAANACNLVTATGSAVASGQSQLLPATEPPATIVSLVAEEASVTSSTTAVLPAVDIGLMAPQITELLPNPDGTGNDTTDEFIELYNPNSVSFDLTGFSLQTGLTSYRIYNFPANTLLPAKSFTVFNSEATSLSLSNTGSQAKLLDPFGNTISTSDIYANAKDGQTWALANGKWYWTTTVTSGAANVIKQPVSKKTKAAAAKSTKKTKAGVKGAKTTKAAKPTTLASSYTEEEPPTTPIHAWTLALVAGGALLYGAYEYRADLANRMRQLRSQLGFGRTDRR